MHFCTVNQEASSRTATESRYHQASETLTQDGAARHKMFPELKRCRHSRGRTNDSWACPPSRWARRRAGPWSPGGKDPKGCAQLSSGLCTQLAHCSVIFTPGCKTQRETDRQLRWSLETCYTGAKGSGPPHPWNAIWTLGSEVLSGRHIYHGTSWLRFGNLRVSSLVCTAIRVNLLFSSVSAGTWAY